MSKEELMLKILTAPADVVERVSVMLDGKREATETGDRRLLTLTGAAREINVSRATIHRMCADGRLPVIETRAGRRRIASASITEFLKGGAV